MIISFGDAATEDLYHGRLTHHTRRFPNSIITPALRKLDLLAAAVKITDLRIPPGNRLERLQGDLDGFYSIRINDQCRIIFRWQDEQAHQVKIIDYH